jgi:YegS/Rv2252/BmrU family lipid kinase
MREEWFALLNPAAGGGQGLRRRVAIEACLRDAAVGYTLALSEYPGHTIQLAAEALRKGFSRFLAIGGDGTLNEIVTGLFADGARPGAVQPPITLALLPVGRGNDWARTHGIPAGWAQAASLLREGSIAAHDVGLIDLIRDGGTSRRCFINVAGVGFDAYVVAKTRSTHLGPLTYLAGLLRGFVGYRAPKLRILADGEDSEAALFVAFAALGRYCGGGMHVAPQARTDDGLLDVTLIAQMGKLELLANLRRLFDGSILEYRRVRSLRVARLEVRCVEPVGVQADGEWIGEAPVAFSVLPRALQVVVPPHRSPG